MIINFYKNLSDKRYVNKNLKSEKSNVTAILKDNTNIKNPIIIVENFSELKSCNYIYISEFERFYYITDIEFSQQRVLIYCECDVLMSFKDEIKNLKCILSRQENRKNLYLNDDRAKAYENSIIETIQFPFGFDRQAFVLAICGGGN